MKSVFGWSYPPGCSGPPDDDGPCECCGRDPNNCECLECPECGEVGNPQCYKEHDLSYSPQQLEGQKQLVEWLEAEAKAEQEYFAEMREDELDCLYGQTTR